MILLNFSHPLSEVQRQQLAAQTDEPITQVIDEIGRASCRERV